MSRRHPYDGDIGGVRASRRRAVADRSALDRGGSKRATCGMWLFATATGLIAGTGLFLGWLFGVTS